MHMHAAVCVYDSVNRMSVFVHQGSSVTAYATPAEYLVFSVIVFCRSLVPVNCCGHTISLDDLGLPPVQI